MPDKTSYIFSNARIATLGENAEGLGLIDNAVLAVKDGKIAYVGPENALPAEYASFEKIDCENRLITPGLVDCHTHLVHAGNRAHEFELRLNGATYEEVARAGGGIVSSVKNLRAASEDDLVRETLPRLDALIAEGVTTVEVKSGYGLDRDSEIKSLKAARRLGEERDVTVRTTFLGAHALPPEMNGDKAAYIDRVINDMLPAIAAENLADAVDGFAKASPSCPTKSPASSMRPRRIIFRSSFMPTSCPICMARLLPLPMMRFQRIIWNIRMRTALPLWPRPER